ncbi:MAG: hypothetical protein PHZ20_04990 [Bacilli bacterium]|nr:hypothetical protein [Bacilli bacterium]MDD4411922.1 hypothetical protein [Bacilli bacterium]
MVNRNDILDKLKSNTNLTMEETQHLQQTSLTDKEAFRMVEEDPEKIAQYEHYCDLREAVKDGTLTEHQLQGLVDTLFSGEQTQDEYFNSNSLYNSLRTKLYNDYRANTTRLIDQERENGAYVSSRYTVEYGDKPACHHQLESISDNRRTVLQQQTWDYNDTFRTEMLEPSIVDYAQRSPMMNVEVKPSENNPNVADFQTYSENNNMLSINNIDINYANNISNAIQQIDPVVFNQQQALAMQSVAPVMTKTMGGFVNVLVLSGIVGFICGLGVFIAIVLCK